MYVGRSLKGGGDDGKAKKMGTALKREANGQIWFEMFGFTGCSSGASEPFPFKRNLQTWFQLGTRKMDRFLIWGNPSFPCVWGIDLFGSSQDQLIEVLNQGHPLGYAVFWVDPASGWHLGRNVALFLFAFWTREVGESNRLKGRCSSLIHAALDWFCHHLGGFSVLKWDPFQICLSVYSGPVPSSGIE